MATPQEQREELQKLNNEIKALYSQLGRTSIPPIFQISDLEKAKDLVIGLKTQLNEINEELSYISSAFRAAVADMSKQNTESAKFKSSLGSISRIATQIRIENEDLSKTDLKRIDSLEKQAKLQFESLKIAAKSGQLSEEEQKEADFALKSKEKFLSTITLIREQQELINKNSGVKLFSGLDDISKAIPGLSKFTSSFQDASKASKEQAAYNLQTFGSVEGLTKKQIKSLQTGKGLNKDLTDRLGLYDKHGKALTGTAAAAKAKAMGITEAASKSMSPMMAGIKSLGPALTKALGPIVLLKELVDAFLQSDKIVGDMAKGLNMSYSEALDMKQELTAAANESGNIFVTSKGMAETLMAINKTLGTNVMLNKEDLATFTELRQVAGFTNDELMGIQSLSLATGKSLEDNTKEFMAQAKISGLQNKVLLNEKELAKEIKNVSAATTLSFSKNPKLLGEAVATAKALGMEMSKVEAIADSLLNFEQSIENELQAELLLGKNINLEKARQAALNNDLKTLAEEIAKQAGNSEEFAKMNRIQQEAIAGAVGMSREELAKTLYIQDQLKGATGKEAEEQEKILNTRIQEVGLAQAQKEMQDKGFEGLKNQASMQDRFNASVEKLKEIFTTVAESMMPMLDILSEVFKIVNYIVYPFQLLSDLAGGLGEKISAVVGPLEGLGKALKVVTGLAIIFAAYKTFAAIASASILTGLGGFAAPILGGIAAAAITTAGFGILNKVGDLNSPAKGKTQISTKEGGLFELSPNDDVIAAPGAARAMARATQPQQPVVIQNDNTESKETNALLRQILSKQGTVKMDATEVGTAFSVNTYSVQ